MANVRNDRQTSSARKTIEENFDFLLWKSELNSELLYFWRTLTEEE